MIYVDSTIIFSFFYPDFHHSIYDFYGIGYYIKLIF